MKVSCICKNPIVLSGVGPALAAGAIDQFSASEVRRRVCRRLSFKGARSNMQAISALEELDRRFGIPGVARISNGNGSLPRIEITGSLAKGQIYLHGAQVTSWKPAGNDEVLFLSTKSRWQ